MGTKGSFPGIKRPGREADHSLPSSAYIKNAWSYASTPQYAFMAWCSFKAQRNLLIGTAMLCPKKSTRGSYSEEQLLAAVSAMK